MENELDRTVFLSKSTFAEHIEKRLLQDKELTYFSAIIEFCAEADKDPEDVLQYMNPVLLEKVRKSAADIGLFKSETYDLEDLV